jgi:hypothetical protein
MFQDFIIDLRIVSFYYWELPFGFQVLSFGVTDFYSILLPSPGNDFSINCCSSSFWNRNWPFLGDFQTSPVNDFLLTSYLSLFLVMERSSESWMLVPALGFIFLTFGFLLTIIGLPRLFHFSFFSGNPMVR